MQYTQVDKFANTELDAEGAKFIISHCLDKANLSKATYCGATLIPTNLCSKMYMIHSSSAAAKETVLRI